MQVDVPCMYVCIINVFILSEIAQLVIRLALRQKVQVSTRSHSATDTSAVKDWNCVTLLEFPSLWEFFKSCL